MLIILIIIILMIIINRDIIFVKTFFRVKKIINNILMIRTLAKSMERKGLEKYAIVLSVPLSLTVKSQIMANEF